MQRRKRTAVRYDFANKRTRPLPVYFHLEQSLEAAQDQDKSLTSTE